MELRTDLAVEAREIAGEDVGGVDFVQYSENGLDISRLEVKQEKPGSSSEKKRVLI